MDCQQLAELAMRDCKVAQALEAASKALDYLRYDVKVEALAQGQTYIWSAYQDYKCLVRERGSK